jgi:hypothetical protein
MSLKHVVSQVPDVINLKLRGSSQELPELDIISLAQMVPVLRRLERSIQDVESVAPYLCMSNLSIERKSFLPLDSMTTDETGVNRPRTSRLDQPEPRGKVGHGFPRGPQFRRLETETTNRS